ncbi:MAG: hypothetical protein M0R67_05570 [Candidatus Cloacimonas sp.]|jgi:hypothetical protein|nr:hypothetical protein [Candidatus Cloacimonas sp.]HNS84227.1 hypothetical protein [Candidatus Cloacimonas sp.]HQM03318.1 hypothetical protein [Candidatus Cloacimonas sp.]HQP33177.1 hypothetical protein [Candidatus Cloacimonas sp.]
MKIDRHFFCELKRYREPAPQLCAVCPRIFKCKSFYAWHKEHQKEYLNFVVEISKKFPDKYTMEVHFMPEKQTFVQIVDMATGKIEKVVNWNEIEALSAEDKLALSRNKNLFIVTHRLEPIVKIELKKTVISAPIQFMESTPKEAEPIEEVTTLPLTPVKPKPKRNPKH